MTTLAQLKLIACALLLGIALYLVYDYTTLNDRNNELDDKVAQLSAELKENQRETAELSKQFVKKAELTKALRDNRQAITTQLETNAHEDPATAEYLHERIPDGVRAPFLD